MSEIEIKPIGHIDTPFKQKFAIPRQPNLANAKGTVILLPEYSDSGVCKGLNNFSHIWLIFQFSCTVEAGWKPAVRAPRLGGNATIGVFASRSPFRPNSIGMSAVKLLGWSQQDKNVKLEVAGVDLLDKTPILDIKPYLPYADSIPEASTPFDSPSESARPIQYLNVSYTPQAERELERYSLMWPDLPMLIEEVLSQDPRPAYKKNKTTDIKTYACRLYDIDVLWRVSSQNVIVEGFTPVASPKASV